MKRAAAVLYLVVSCTIRLSNAYDDVPLDFPKDFVFGTSTSAYQVEGAWNVNGKSPSIWDYFTHNYPEQIRDFSNGDIASNSYNLIKEDVKLLKELGVHFYRFSLSWPRIVPSPLTRNVNPDGIRYYNKLINELLNNNIKPMITLFHWDLPYSLQKFGGFTNSLIIEAFVNYARIAFEHFGDRVRLWTTFNEPHIFCTYGYGESTLAPAYNESGIADYLCTYNLLKAHAATYHLYNDTFKHIQKGAMSINLSGKWYEPATYSPEDTAAAKRAMEFELGLFAHPIFTLAGDYPKVVKDHVAKRSHMEGYTKSRLPSFTQEEVAYIRGTYDYLALNHYTTEMAEHKDADPIGTAATAKDRNVHTYSKSSWTPTVTSNFEVPWGFRKILVWIKEHYGNPCIYITENGYPDKGELHDVSRIRFYYNYLKELLNAVYDHGVRVKGYAAWSLLDNFEWLQGYTVRFGLYHVDFSNPLRPRTPKSSANYYKKIVSTNSLIPYDTMNY